MVRACMEGVALSLRHNLEVAESAGARANVLRAMGGSANSLLWTQIKADITGKKIVVPASDTATTLGAALLAGVGTCLLYTSNSTKACDSGKCIRQGEKKDEEKNRNLVCGDIVYDYFSDSFSRRPEQTNPTGL